MDHNKLWKILKEVGIPDHLTCLLRNLYAGLVKAMVFPVVMYGVRVGLCRKLSAEELMLLNCGVGEDS